MYHLSPFQFLVNCQTANNMKQIVNFAKLLIYIELLFLKILANKNASSEDPMSKCFSNDNKICWPKCCKESQIFSVQKGECEDGQKNKSRYLRVQWFYQKFYIGAVFRVWFLLLSVFGLQGASKTAPLNYTPKHRVCN